MVIINAIGSTHKKITWQINSFFKTKEVIEETINDRNDTNLRGKAAGSSTGDVTREARGWAEGSKVKVSQMSRQSSALCRSCTRMGIWPSLSCSTASPPSFPHTSISRCSLIVWERLLLTTASMLDLRSVMGRSSSFILLDIVDESSLSSTTELFPLWSKASLRSIFAIFWGWFLRVAIFSFCSNFSIAMRASRVRITPSFSESSNLTVAIQFAMR